MNLATIQHHRQGRRGMVLLEVMTALAIFILVAFALIQALQSAFDAEMDRNQIDMALRGLENQMALLHSARVVPGESDAPDDGTGILYHIAVVQMQLQDEKSQPVANMYRATITATWKLRGQDQEQDVSELIYQP